MAASDTIWLTFDIGTGVNTVPFPDIEAIVAAWLRQSGLSVGDRVYTKIPAQPEFPLLLIRRVGGVPAGRDYLDAASIQVDVWGDTKAEAHDLAQAARDAILELEGTSVFDPIDAFIPAVEDALGLTWLPDPETGRDRYVFEMTVYARGLEVG